MANGYQGRHVRPRSGSQPGGGAAITIAALIVVAAVWLAVSQMGNHGGPSRSDHASGRVQTSEGATTTVDTPTSTEPTIGPDAATTGANPDTGAGTGAGSGVAAGVAAGRPARGGATATTRSVVPAAKAAGTPASTATTVNVAPPGPVGVYIPPTATRTSYHCVAAGAGWDLTYSVQFSGGRGWIAPGGGTTSTVHMVAASTVPGRSAPPYMSVNHAQVVDTVDGQLRVVALTNPIVVHCPASG